MGDADLTAIFYGKKKEETNNTTSAEAGSETPGPSTSSETSVPTKERKHILSVSNYPIYEYMLSLVYNRITRAGSVILRFDIVIPILVDNIHLKFV